MKVVDRIKKYICDNISVEYIKNTPVSEIGVDAGEIEENLGIVRNNASTLLNRLNKENFLVKINSRPVRFLLADTLRQFTKKDDIPFCVSQEELQEILCPKVSSADPFMELVGYNYSLKNQIGQAKAALMYPSNGLHTLLLGETGVGKTTFARKMYEYAKSKKNNDQGEFPFVSFNCADYYNNPQLLVSHLFGYVKGAFTGADIDKEGLVERANNGILFLDEVHRLPPDGQEMLFHFMDHGTFSRLGETQRKRKGNVLIIAATTENPDNVLLNTFTRRIPVVITIPPFRDKSIRERVKIIKALFRREALRLKMPILLEPEVLKSLATYECSGNIGQLYSEVKLVCAKAFLVYLHKKDELVVKFSMLSRDIKDSVFDGKMLGDEIKIFLNDINSNIVIKPTKEDILDTGQVEENLYDLLLKRLSEIKRLGLSDEEVNIRINEEAHSYYRKMLQQFNFRNHNIRDLYRIIDDEIVNVTVELVNIINSKLNSNFSNKLLFALSFHIQALLVRIKTGEYVEKYETQENDIEDKYWKIGTELVEHLNNKFDVKIPYSEVFFFSMILSHADEEEKDEDKIGLLIISHGENTATSMANVCNRLLNSNYVKGLDMSLDSSDEEIYVRAVNMIKQMNKGKGVLVLADMGSAVTFGRRVTDETGIITRTIDKVSTPIALEALRKVIYNDGNIEEVFNSLNRTITPIDEKNNVILSVCATGQGASVIAKNMLSETLEQESIGDIKIITLDYSKADTSSDEYIDIVHKYNVICCVGSLKPMLDVPFFHIAQVLSKTMREPFVKFLKSQHCCDETRTIKSAYDEAKEILEKNLLFINVPIAISYIKQVIGRLNENLPLGNDKVVFNLVMHIACMIERLTRDHIAKFEDVDIFIKDNMDFYKSLKHELKVLEKIYQISIPDDEVGYIIKIINNPC